MFFLWNFGKFSRHFFTVYFWMALSVESNREYSKRLFKLLNNAHLLGKFQITLTKFAEIRGWNVPKCGKKFGWNQFDCFPSRETIRTFSNNILVQTTEIYYQIYYQLCLIEISALWSKYFLRYIHKFVNRGIKK